VFCDGNDSQHHNNDTILISTNVKTSNQFSLLPVSDITQDFLIRLVNYDDIQLYMTNRLYEEHIQGIEIVIILTGDLQY